MWGEPLVELANAGGGLDDDVSPKSWELFGRMRRVWTFKIRSRACPFRMARPLTAEDVMATMERHSGEDTKSGALGIMRGIKAMRAEGMRFRHRAVETANADLPYLLTDYHLLIQPNGGNDDPTAR